MTKVKVIQRDCSEADFDKSKISTAILKAMKNGSGIIKPKIAEDIADEIEEECKDKDEFHLIPLGVGMKLPDGYEANIVPRSSTYKNFKVLQTNSFAVIDNSYSGDNDQWLYPVIAMEDTIIHKNDRVCQFRINKIQPEIEFEEVKYLDDVSRGGFGSTGKA